MKQSEVLHKQRLEFVVSVLDQMPDITGLATKAQDLVNAHAMFSQVKAEYNRLKSQEMQEGQVHMLLMEEVPSYRQLQESIDVLKETYKNRTNLDPAYGSSLHEEYRHQDELRQAYLVQYTKVLNAETQKQLDELKEGFPEEYAQIEQSEAQIERKDE